MDYEPQSLFQPLIEKLQTREKLSFDDFRKVLDVIREARADGRISVIEMYRIGKSIFDLISEIFDQLPDAGGTGDFGFLKTAPQTPPQA